MKKKKYPSDYLAVFRPTLAKQATAMFVLVILLGITIPSSMTMIQSDNNIVFSVFWVAVVGFMLWTMFMTIARDKLVITDEGLLWWRYGFQKQAPWDDLSHFTWHSRGKSSVWGIATHSNKFIPLGDYFSVHKKTLFNQQTIVEDFRQSEAGSYFHQYASHLFGELKEKAKKAHHSDNDYSEQPEYDLYTADESLSHQKQKKQS